MSFFSIGYPTFPTAYPNRQSRNDADQAEQLRLSEYLNNQNTLTSPSSSTPDSSTPAGTSTTGDKDSLV